jgi:hypothetical protein
VGYEPGNYFKYHGKQLKYQWVRAWDRHLGQNLIPHGILSEDLRYEIFFGLYYIIG